MRYRRHYLAGGTYFFTVNLWDRSQSLLVDNINILRQAVRDVKTQRPFTIEAWVVLPDHLHAVWTLPEGDCDYSSRWRDIKKYFSMSLPATEPVSTNRSARGERGVWQRRFWEHTIKNDHDFQQHVDYVHINPLKHGFVTRVCDWPYSSFHRYVKKGFYHMDWGAQHIAGEAPSSFGE